MPVHVIRIFLELQYYALTFDFWTKNFYKGDTLLIFQAVTSQSFKVERINISSDPSRPKQQSFPHISQFYFMENLWKSTNIKVEILIVWSKLNINNQDNVKISFSTTNIVILESRQWYVFNWVRKGMAKLLMDSDCCMRKSSRRWNINTHTSRNKIIYYMQIKMIFFSNYNIQQRTCEWIKTWLHFWSLCFRLYLSDFLYHITKNNGYIIIVCFIITFSTRLLHCLILNSRHDLNAMT